MTITDKQVDAAVKAIRAYCEENPILKTGIYDYGHEHQAVRNALEAAEQAAWQPIETVPMDGTWVLVYKNPFFVRQVGYSKTKNTWCVEKVDGFTVALDFTPTHWQPLPDAPTDHIGDVNEKV